MQTSGHCSQRQTHTFPSQSQISSEPSTLGSVVGQECPDVHWEPTRIGLVASGQSVGFSLPPRAPAAPAVGCPAAPPSTLRSPADPSSVPASPAVAPPCEAPALDSVSAGPAGAPPALVAPAEPPVPKFSAAPPLLSSLLLSEPPAPLVVAAPAADDPAVAFSGTPAADALLPTVVELSEQACRPSMRRVTEGAVSEQILANVISPGLACDMPYRHCRTCMGYLGALGWLGGLERATLGTVWHKTALRQHFQ